MADDFYRVAIEAADNLGLSDVTVLRKKKSWRLIGRMPNGVPVGVNFAFTSSDTYHARHNVVAELRRNVRRALTRRPCKAA